MKVLKIKLISEDGYYQRGIKSILSELLLIGASAIEYLPNSSSDLDSNLIFLKNVIILNITYLDGSSHIMEPAANLASQSYHTQFTVPFTGYQRSIIELKDKIAKVIEIATAHYYRKPSVKDICLRFNINPCQQLSVSERTVMKYIGQGDNFLHIANKLGRSVKTVKTHYRHATRKVGMENRAEFYRYAHYLSLIREKEANILCL